MGSMPKLLKTRTRKGFTLIELIIVVAIIGVLAAVAIPLFNSYRARSFNTSAHSDIYNAKVKLEAYYIDLHLYP